MPGCTAEWLRFAWTADAWTAAAVPLCSVCVSYAHTHAALLIGYY